MTDELIKYMVNRFLGWKLPANFHPDAGISFKAAFNEHTAHPMKHEPSGTNLFDADQATAMVRYMIDGLAHAEERMRIARAICKSRSCEGMACCQWPANGGRTKRQCPVYNGGYDDAADAAMEALRSTA